MHCIDSVFPSRGFFSQGRGEDITGVIANDCSGTFMLDTYWCKQTKHTLEQIKVGHVMYLHETMFPDEAIIISEQLATC